MRIKMTNYTPKNLELWTRPSHYFGATWEGYYVFLGRNRDSDDLTESNFECGLESIGGEGGEIPEGYEDSGENSRVVARERHWACGWIELIYIHESDTEALIKADKIAGELKDYPVLNEDDWSEREMESANRVWRDCYDWQERIEHIRKYREQFEFYNLADMIAVIKGKYFNGYAEELLY